MRTSTGCIVLLRSLLLARRWGDSLFRCLDCLSGSGKEKSWGRRKLLGVSWDDAKTLVNHGISTTWIPQLVDLPDFWSINSIWVVVSDVFNVHPDTWGNDPIWLIVLHIGLKPPPSLPFFHQIKECKSDLRTVVCYLYHLYQLKNVNKKCKSYCTFPVLAPLTCRRRMQAFTVGFLGIHTEDKVVFFDFMSLIFLELFMAQSQKRGSQNTTQMNPPIGQSDQKFGAAVRDPDYPSIIGVFTLHVYHIMKFLLNHEFSASNGSLPEENCEFLVNYSSPIPNTNIIIQKDHNAIIVFCWITGNPESPPRSRTSPFLF